MLCDIAIGSKYIFMHVCQRYVFLLCKMFGFRTARFLYCVVSKCEAMFALGLNLNVKNIWLLLDVHSLLSVVLTPD